MGSRHGPAAEQVCMSYALARWKLLQAKPGEFANSKQLADRQHSENLTWHDAVVPGTVIQSLKACGLLSNEPATDFQSLEVFDWLYRCEIPAAAPQPNGEEFRLRFEGLATLAEVWLNDTLILKSQNMFRPQECDVTALLKEDNTLCICFRSLPA